MSCLVSLNFLNSKSQTWKDYYIKLKIPISGPFSGSMKTIQGILVVSLFPSPGKRTSDEPWVLTKKGNYTIKNIDKLYKTFNLDDPLGLCRWSEVRTFIADTKEPKVDSMCFYGSGIDTLKQLDYKNTNYPHNNPKQYYEKADGIVNYESLARCTTWSNLTHLRYHRQYPHTTHVGILHNLQIIKTIYDHINRDIARPQWIISNSVKNITFSSIF
ncbi:hypothetical protein A3Q56_06883 [Intoshia linei]|uniref:Uncharacterized protein n=1 Tax=Intoshia linei TaxID=1819745 RepID=A0A177ATN8_9BILA|nr:hypothetical protein A3Q56_06883 [Intoshia linei]